MSIMIAVWVSDACGVEVGGGDGGKKKLVLRRGEARSVGKAVIALSSNLRKRNPEE